MSGVETHGTGRRTKRIDAGPAETIEVGRFTMITAGGHRIGVTRLRNGQIRAVRDRCPHKAAPICQGIIGGTWPPSAEVGELTFARDDEILVCPWHGFEYDLDTGQELFWPRRTRLRLYPSEIIEGRVIVSVPEGRSDRDDLATGAPTDATTAAATTGSDERHQDSPPCA